MEALKLLNVSRIMDVSWETQAVCVVKVNIRTDGRWAGTVLRYLYTLYREGSALYVYLVYGLQGQHGE